MNKLVYLDYAATTPIDEQVAQKMMKYMTFDGVFGNPASRSHGFGWQAEEAVETHLFRPTAKDRSDYG